MVTIRRERLFCSIEEWESRVTKSREQLRRNLGLLPLVEDDDDIPM